MRCCADFFMGNSLSDPQDLLIPFLVNLTALPNVAMYPVKRPETVVLINSSDANATIFSGC